MVPPSVPNYYRPQSWEIMYLVASVCPPVCNQCAYADNCGDAVDRLLIYRATAMNFGHFTPLPVLSLDEEKTAKWSKLRERS